MLDTSKIKDSFSEENVDKNVKNAQRILEDNIRDDLPVFKTDRQKNIVPLKCFVLKKWDNIMVIMLCNERMHTLVEKKEQIHYQYHPGAYIIIDNRPTVTQIAIEKTPAFDNEPDRIKNIFEEYLKRLFQPYNLTVELRPKKYQKEFWDVITEHQTKKHPISKLVFNFPTKYNGPVDKPADMMKEKNFLYNMIAFGSSLNAASGKLSMEPDKGETINLSKRQEDVAHLVNLCSSNGYDISVHFGRFGLYRYGDEVRALGEISDFYVTDFINGTKILFSDCSLLGRLDEIYTKIKDGKDDSEAQ